MVTLSGKALPMDTSLTQRVNQSKMTLLRLENITLNRWERNLMPVCTLRVLLIQRMRELRVSITHNFYGPYFM